MFNTRRSLILSLLALLLCTTMFVGTTYAWMTDSVTSGANKIVAGNLDIELEYSKTMENNSWQTVGATTNLFTDNNGNAMRWEPGAASVVYLKISNKGNLAFKYYLGINVESEIVGINVMGDEFRLSDYIKFGQVTSSVNKYATNEDAINAVASSAKNISNGYSLSGTMSATGDYKVLALIVYMPNDVGSAANHKTGTLAPTINMGVQLKACQVASESDGFGSTYDSLTPWLGGTEEIPSGNISETEVKIENAEQLAYFAQNISSGTYNNKTIKLVNDIDLNKIDWTPITVPSGSSIIFDGNSKTISHLKISGGSNLGFFSNGNGLQIKDLNFEKANIYCVGGGVGTVVGYGNGVKIDNVTVNNATIVASPLMEEKPNVCRGDKVGGIVGCIQSAEDNPSITNCSVTNTTIQGYRDVGGIIGQSCGSITNNSVKTITLINDRSFNYENYTDVNDCHVNSIVGEKNSENVSGNTEEKVTKNSIVSVPDNGTGDQIKTWTVDSINAMNSGDTVIIPWTEESIDLSDATITSNEVVVKGNNQAKIKISDNKTLTVEQNKKIIFDGVNFEFGNNSSVSGKAIYKNCNLNGKVNISVKGKFYGCSFSSDTEDVYLVDVQSGEAYFDTCTFNGTDRCVLAKSSTSGTTKADFINCVFDFSKTAAASCVMIEGNANSDYSICFEKCSDNNKGRHETLAASGEYYFGLYGLDHNSAEVKGIVIVNGLEVYKKTN